MGSIEYFSFPVFTIEIIYWVFTELFEIGVNRKVLFFYGHNSEGSLIGARVVEKSTEKGVEKCRLQPYRDFP